MGTAFFPLDNEWELPAVALLPHAYQTLVRLASCMPFAQAAETLCAILGVRVSAATVRRQCEQVGSASLQVQQEQAQPLASCPEEPPGERMVMSSDGAYVPLVKGEWGEVKLLAIGQAQCHSPTRPAAGELPEVRTTQVSYFARLADAPTFGEQASAEIRRRGIERAKAVCAVQDGADWLQGFVHSHRQDAVRILDFAHAAGYISEIGEAVRSSGGHLPRRWLEGVLHRLKHAGPERVLRHLSRISQRCTDPEVAKKLRYLQARREQMEYPTYRQAGWPIGSGMVESGNKLVMQARLKGAGMHWRREQVNPMLALRMAVCNRRWEENWRDQWRRLSTARQQQRWQHQQQRFQKGKQAFHASVASAPAPQAPALVQLAKPKGGRTEAQFRWGRQTFSPRMLRQGSNAKK